MNDFRQSKPLNWLALAFGLYYMLTGLWPLLHIESFVWVTGPKVDLWLVKTVGVLILVIGGVVFLAGKNKRITLEIVLLAIGAAAGLTAIDVYYVAVDRIWRIYLLDSVAEIVLIGLWILFWSQAKYASKQ